MTDREILEEYVDLENSCLSYTEKESINGYDILE